MEEELTVCLTIEEIFVIKRWFKVVKHHSHVEERDRTVADKLSRFEADMYLKTGRCE